MCGGIYVCILCWDKLVIMWNIKDIELEKYQMELYVMVFRNVYVGFFILMKKKNLNLGLFK